MTERFVASSDAKNIELDMRREGNEYVLNGLVGEILVKLELLCTDSLQKWWISSAGDPRCEL